MATRDDIACLNRLANILVDARRLYARAARIADDPDVVERIDRTMAEREKLLTEIRSLIISLHGADRDNGTFLGAAHKAFLNVRSLFDRDERAALGEVLRGERYLCDEIRKAMRDDELSAEVRAFLGLALDRIVNVEMRIEGTLEQIERARANESIHPIPPHS
ncbi:MAG: PA2169 family four-helix-bundle protein [Alphaproteobacteria bacterium]|nr:PA2169 family four-helix-bundle protein [Alphaproteobacteria bacterium]